MPLRPCLGVHGQSCGRLSRESRCPEHQAEMERRREAARPSWVERYGRDWPRIARRVIREEQACAACGHTGSTDNPLTAGHIVPRSKGGGSDRDNLRCECRRCNSAKGAR